MYINAGGSHCLKISFATSVVRGDKLQIIGVRLNGMDWIQLRSGFSKAMNYQKISTGSYICHCDFSWRSIDMLFSGCWGN